ncbi:hypothetical protein MSG28_010236 [Choristoneura fumiferana]|uniref:Uncharacterized protein n=1 Tax=Choristoneura fumiferana TaxID=7141 RepID=A0ACC0KJU9_CHOFU|nr:hypothetical protein MSG28_010236 [Choristoneura fumiferana]
MKMPPTTCKALLKDYCSNCTFAGVHFIADDTKHWFERLVWVALVALSWYGSAILIIAAWDAFRESPISFGVETTYTKWETKLPSVAVCETENTEKLYSVCDTLRSKKEKTKAYVEMVLAFLPTERFKRIVVRSRLDLVVSIGGTTGLFVGASLLSFVELIIYFTVRFAINIWLERQGRTNKVVIKEDGEDLSNDDILIVFQNRNQGLGYLNGGLHRVTPSLTIYYSSCIDVSLGLNTTQMAGELENGMKLKLGALGGGEACGARWALAALLLAPLAAANSSYCAVLAVLLLAVFITVASKFHAYSKPYCNESMMFTFMLLILLYIFSQFFAILGLINLDIANINMPIPVTIYEVSFELRVILTSSIDAALPVTTLIEAREQDGFALALAAVTVAGISLALTELCPILFSILVALASPEWKVLTRSMTYESTTTGSPVLAVFTAVNSNMSSHLTGSLAAILAFACPLSHMITLMNASHLIGIAIQAFHFMIMRCVPTAEQKEAGDVEYKRLGTEGKARVAKIPEKKKRGLWFIPSAIRHTKTLESIKSKVTAKETEERECLLLDENKFKDPIPSEGFKEVIAVDFNPCFDDKDAEELYRMHLLENYSLPKYWKIRVGSSYRSQGGSLHRIKTIIVQRDFNPYYYTNDIAVLVVAKPFALGLGVRQGTISKLGNEIRTNSTCTVIGWGATESSGMLSEQLRYATVLTVDHRICSSRYSHIKAIISDSMICASHLDRGGIDGCFGDSGGPLLYKGVVVGLVSFGFACGHAYYPGVYTKISSFTDWIIKTITTYK